MAISLMPLPQIQLQPNQLDFSGIQNALAGYAKGQEKAYEGESDKLIGNALAGPGGIEEARKIAAQRGNLDTNLGLAKFGMAQKADNREETKFQEERQQRGAMQLAKMGEMILKEADPTKQQSMFDQIMKMPQLADAHKSLGLPAEIANDPVVFSRHVMALAAPYRDQLATAHLQSEINKNNAAATNEIYKPIPENASGVFSGRTGEIKELGGIGGDPTQRIITKEAAKAQGQAIGNARVALPETLRAGDLMVSQIDQLMGNKELGIKGDKRLGSVIGPFDAHPWVPTWRGDSQATQARIDQIKGGTFMQAFNTLKGGGQITEQEGAKATAALNRLGNQRQDEASYRDALKEFRSEVVKLMEIAKQRATVPGGSQQAAPGGMPQIKDDADYDRLPSGAQFIDPNGKPRIKP